MCEGVLRVCGACVAAGDVTWRCVEPVGHVVSVVWCEGAIEHMVACGWRVNLFCNDFQCVPM